MIFLAIEVASLLVALLGLLSGVMYSVPAVADGKSRSGWRPSSCCSLLPLPPSPSSLSSFPRFFQPRS